MVDREWDSRIRRRRRYWSLLGTVNKSFYWNFTSTLLSLFQTSYTYTILISNKPISCCICAADPVHSAQFVGSTTYASAGCSLRGVVKLEHTPHQDSKYYRQLPSCEMNSQWGGATPAHLGCRASNTFEGALLHYNIPAHSLRISIHFIEGKHSQSQ